MKIFLFPIKIELNVNAKSILNKILEYFQKSTKLFKYYFKFVIFVIKGLLIIVIYNFFIEKFVFKQL